MFVAEVFILIQKFCFNLYISSPNVPASTEVLSSMSEMKGEVRREMEAMSMKMSQLEQQISTILDLLKSQGHLNSRASGSSGNFRHSMDSNVTGDVPDSNTKKSLKDLHTSSEKEQNRLINNSEFNNLNMNTESEKEDADPLPDWLAPPGSPMSHHSHESIADWEEEQSSDKEKNAAEAVRTLNENKPGSSDPRIMQKLNLLKKK